MFKKTTLIIFSIFLLFAQSVFGFEQVGKASYDFSSIGKFEENKSIIIDNAKKDACSDAYKKYLATFNQDKLKNYARVKSKIESNLNSYIDCNAVVDESLDFANNKYNIVVKASVNTNKIEQAMISTSAVATKKGEGSEIVMFMVSRTVSSVKQKDNRRTTVNQNEKSQDINQTEAAKDGNISISSQTVTTDKQVSGGNTIESAPEISYKIEDGYNEAISGGMEELLNTAGFELVPSFEFASLDQINNDVKIAFSQDSSLPPKLRRGIGTAMKDEGIKYWVEGIFDIGKMETDPATGAKVVNVSVTRATLWGANSKGRFRSVATVSGNQRKGKGTSYDQAVKNGIRLCAQSVAKQMVDKLNAKGVN